MSAAHNCDWTHVSDSSNWRNPAGTKLLSAAVARACISRFTPIACAAALAFARSTSSQISAGKCERSPTRVRLAVAAIRVAPLLPFSLLFQI